jgi:hypothetical protein
VAKLALSLWNGQCAFSRRECLTGFNEERTAPARRLVSYIAEYAKIAIWSRWGMPRRDLPQLWELDHLAD